MPTIIQTLTMDTVSREELHTMHKHMYLHGECYAFALALHQGLEWPLVALMREDVFWHVGVRAPCGKLHDVRGLLTEEEFASQYLSAPFDFRDVTPEDLYATRPIDDFVIKRARSLAEVLWPDLPWRELSTDNVKAFADGLEALSRKHGLWICGSVPADSPRLFTGGGEEGGYEIFPTLDGLSHTINRWLPSELQMREAKRFLGEED